MAFKRSYLDELKSLTHGSNDGTVKLDFLTGTVDLTSTLENCWSMVEFFSIIDSRFIKSNWNYEMRGVNRYTSTLRYGNSGFFVACNPDSIDNLNTDIKDMKVFVCLGGSDINQFGSELVIKILKRLESLNFSCSRCDLAYDMIEDTGIVNKFCSAFENFVSGQKNIVTNIHSENFKIAGAGKFEGKNYENWTIGSRTSAVFCRFYDKRVERKLRSKTIEKLHHNKGLNDDEYEYLSKRAKFWYRFEIELKGSWAKWVFPHLVDGTAYGDLFGHSMSKIFRIVEDSTKDVSHASRSATEPWFDDFLSVIKKTDFVQLPVSQKVEKKMLSTIQWAISCTPSFAVFRLIRVMDLAEMANFELDALERAYKSRFLRSVLNDSGYYYDGTTWSNDIVENMNTRHELGFDFLAEEYTYAL